MCAARARGAWNDKKETAALQAARLFGVAGGRQNV
jgi:hypothetical protein